MRNARCAVTVVITKRPVYRLPRNEICIGWIPAVVGAGMDISAGISELARLKKASDMEWPCKAPIRKLKLVAIYQIYQ